MILIIGAEDKNLKVNNINRDSSIETDGDNSKNKNGEIIVFLI